jgi:hypothetical protein
MGTTSMRPRGRRLAGALVLVAASVLAGCSDDGADAARDGFGRVVSAGAWSVFELQAGDCLSPDPDLVGEVAEIAVVPCDEPHTQEIFSLVEHGAEAFPGSAVLAQDADAECVGALQRDYGVSPADGYFVSYLLPSFDSWNKEDDRRITCVLVFPTSDDVHRSVLDEIRAQRDATTTTVSSTTMIAREG